MTYSNGPHLDIESSIMIRYPYIRPNVCYRYTLYCVSSQKELISLAPHSLLIASSAAFLRKISLTSAYRTPATHRFHTPFTPKFHCISCTWCAITDLNRKHKTARDNMPLTIQAVCSSLLIPKVCLAEEIRSFHVRVSLPLTVQSSNIPPSLVIRSSAISCSSIPIMPWHACGKWRQKSKSSRDTRLIIPWIISVLSVQT